MNRTHRWSPLAWAAAFGLSLLSPVATMAASDPASPSSEVAKTGAEAGYNSGKMILGQTFKTTAAGTLDSISIQVQSAAQATRTNLLVYEASAEDLNGKSPIATSLGGGCARGGYPTQCDYWFNNKPVQLKANTSYTFVVLPGGTLIMSLSASDENPYADGGMVASGAGNASYNPATGFSATANQDLWFKTRITPAPEPTRNELSNAGGEGSYNSGKAVLGQTFKTTSAGSLASIQIKVQSAAQATPTTLLVYEAAAQDLNGKAPLATSAPASCASGGFPAVCTYTFSAPPTVKARTSYTFVVRPNGTLLMNLAGSNQNPYYSGSMVSSSSGPSSFEPAAGFASVDSSDLWFIATIQ